MPAPAYSGVNSRCPSAKGIGANDGKGKLRRTLTGKSIAGVSFDTPTGIAQSAAGKELIVTDLENRILRVPLAGQQRRAKPLDREPKGGARTRGDRGGEGFAT